MSNTFKSVVFVCTGNFYRSRFSECLFNALAKERGLSWHATSRGLRTGSGSNVGPLSELAAYRLTALGIPFGVQRFPAQLSETDLEDADLVIALKEAEHQAMMIEQFPAWADRVTYWNIDDIECATADEALPMCESCVRALVDRLLAEQGQEVPARVRRTA
jgi:protein-tyrosine phosphatase